MASRSRRSAVVTAYFFGKSIADLAFPAATADSPHLTRCLGVVTESVTPRGLQFVRWALPSALGSCMPWFFVVCVSARQVVGQSKPRALPVLAPR